MGARNYNHGCQKLYRVSVLVKNLKWHEFVSLQAQWLAQGHGGMRGRESRRGRRGIGERGHDREDVRQGDSEDEG